MEGKTLQGRRHFVASSEAWFMCCGCALTLVILLSHRVDAAQVVVQSSGEALVNAACRALTERDEDDAPTPPGAQAAHGRGGRGTPEVPGAPSQNAAPGAAASTRRANGMIIEADWLHTRDRADLPYLLGYLALTGKRATLELPATRYNDGPMTTLDAFGGLLLERDINERPGVTRAIATTFLEGDSTFLLLDDFIPRDNDTITRKFIVQAVDSAIVVTILTTRFDGHISLIGPDGRRIREARRSSKAIQWEISDPSPGEWRILYRNTLRVRTYVQTSRSWDPGLPCTFHESGALSIRRPQCRWELDRVTQDGLRRVRRGNSEDSLQFEGRGVYAATIRSASGNVIRRAGLLYGPRRPLLFRPPRMGTADTTLRCSVFGTSDEDLERVSATVGGVPAALQLSPKGQRGAFALRQVQISLPGGLGEGAHRVEVKVGEGENTYTDSWIYVYDVPQARELRISEFHLGQGWVEVEALADIADLSSFAITDLDSEPIAFPAIALRAGDRFALQTERRSQPPYYEAAAMQGRGVGFSPRDQVVLVRGQEGQFAVIDALIYDDGSDGRWNDEEKDDIEFLVSRGEWDRRPLRLFGPFASVQRNGSSDANRLEDWAPAYYSTPGRPAADASAAQLPSSGSVIISEVHVWGAGSPWIEIEALRGPVDIAPLTVSTFNGDGRRLGDYPQVLQQGQRKVIRWGNAGAQQGDIILDGDAPARTFDQVALLLGVSVVDAVAWHSDGAQQTRDELKDLRRHNLTPIERPSLVPGSGSAISLARGTSGFAWTAMPTPGAPNEFPREPANGAVRILAVSPSEFDHDWAELICLSGTVDISRFILTDLDAEDPPLAEASFTLRQGETVVIHWADGRDETDTVGDLNRNGVRDLYIPYVPGLSSTDDQLVLVWGGKIHDAVIFTNIDGTISSDEKKDYEYLINAGQWSGTVNQNSAVNIGTYRLPVERANPNQDTNSKNDWRTRSPATSGK